MNPPKDSRKTIEEQVIAKVQWNTPDDDILEWLGSKHGILHEDADQMLVRAKAIRTKVVRERAAKVVLVTSIALVAALAYIAVNPWSWGFDLRAIVLAISFIAMPFLLIALIRNAVLLTRGDTAGPIER
jgi:hypothetical protein